MNVTDLIKSYIDYRHSIGEKFETNARILRAYVKFIGPEVEYTDITEELNVKFLYHPVNYLTAHWFVKHTALKGLFNWCVCRGLMVNIPLPLVVPKRLSHIPAYIYSKDELKRLFNYSLESKVFYTEVVRVILKLTFMLGLRISETISLKLRNIDLNNNAITVDTSKFYKSRICTFNNYVRGMLIRFLKWRKAQEHPTGPDAPLFFYKTGTPIRLDSFQHLFIKIRKDIGLDFITAGRFKPRLHDLRHTFAVTRLKTWYENGENVQELLPVLATYLGHKTLSYTSVYLTMTPELLKNVNARFEEYANIKE